jgi:hypothetical protein
MKHSMRKAQATEFINLDTKESMKNDLAELQKMLIASIKTSKAKK